MNKQPIQNNPLVVGLILFLAFAALGNAFAAMYTDSGIMVHIAVFPIALFGSFMAVLSLYTGGN